MRIIPHFCLRRQCLPGFYYVWFTGVSASLDGQFTLCGSMLLAWLAAKTVAPRYAVIAAMIIDRGSLSRKVTFVTTDVVFKPVLPTYIPLIFVSSPRLSVASPLLVTMASQTHRIAAMKAAGYSAPASPLIVFTGLLALCFFPFRRFIPWYCGNHRGYLPKPGSASG